MRFIRGAIIANWKLFPIPRHDDLKYSRHWQFLTVSTETDRCRFNSSCVFVYVFYYSVVSILIFVDFLKIHCLLLSKWFCGLFLLLRIRRTSLVAQSLRVRLPIQGTRVRALVRENSTCRGATKPVHHNYWACALEPASHNYWARMPRAHALQQEKPPQWEARAPKLEKARAQQRRPNTAKK